MRKSYYAILIVSILLGIARNYAHAEPTITLAFKGYGGGGLFTAQTPILTVGKSTFMPGKFGIYLKGKQHKKSKLDIFVHKEQSNQSNIIQCENGPVDIRSQIITFEPTLRRANYVIAYICNQAIFKRILTFNNVEQEHANLHFPVIQGLKLLAAIEYILQYPTDKKAKRVYIKHVLTKYMTFVYFFRLHKLMTELAQRKRQLSQQEYNLITGNIKNINVPVSIQSLEQLSHFHELPHKPSMYQSFIASMSSTIKADTIIASAYLSKHFRRLFSIENNKAGETIITPIFYSFRIIKEIMGKPVKEKVEEYTSQIIKMVNLKAVPPKEPTYHDFDYTSEYNDWTAYRKERKIKPLLTRFDYKIPSWKYYYSRNKEKYNYSPQKYRPIVKREKRKTRSSNTLAYLLDYLFYIFLTILITYTFFIFINRMDKTIDESNRKKEEKEKQEQLRRDLVKSLNDEQCKLNDVYDKRKHNKHLSERMQVEVVYFLKLDIEDFCISDDTETLQKELDALKNCIQTIETINATLDKKKREKLPESSIDHQHQKNLQRAENKKLIGEVEDLLKDAKNRGSLQAKLNEIIEHHNDLKFRPSKVKHALLNLKSEIDI